MRRVIAYLLAAVTSGMLAAAPANWVEHKNAKGFVVKHPPGWVVETPEKDMVVVRDSTGGIQAIAMGFMTRPEVSARQWLEQLPERFPTRFQKVRLEPVAQRRPEQGVVRMRYTSRWGDGRATVLCRLDRGAGMMFAIAAPVFRFEELAPDLVEILRTFTVTQAPGAEGQQGQQQARSAPPNPLAGVSFVRWRDPVENAFWLDVPSGWRVEGGTVRRSAADVHGYLRIGSPDGITLFSSDRDLMTFVVPNQTLLLTGFREGSIYSPGYGTQLMVMRYQPGIVFAEQWARRVGGGGIAIRDRRRRDDLAQRADALYRQAGGSFAQITNTFGEVSFTTPNGQAGYVLAGTQLTSMMGAGMWTAETLLGFVAPPQRVPTTLAVMGRMLATFQVNPQWFAGQQQVIAQTSRIVTETNNYISQLQSETYWSTQAAQDRAFQNYSDYQRGIQVVVDPNTGLKYEAVAGHNYYYLPPGSTTTIATDTQAPPNIDLTELFPTRR